jgi:hypothetical protein
LKPGTSQINRSSGFASDERLRRQLLGRNYRSPAPSRLAERNVVGNCSTKDINGGSTRVQGQRTPRFEYADDNEDNNDERGRSSIIGSKNMRNHGKHGQTRRVEPLRKDVKDDRTDEEIPKADGADHQSEHQSMNLPSLRSKKRSGGSYLDELLADRVKKKKAR